MGLRRITSLDILDLHEPHVAVRLVLDNLRRNSTMYAYVLARRVPGFFALLLAAPLLLNACASGPAPLPAPVPVEADPEPMADAPAAVAAAAEPMAPAVDPALDTVRAGIFDNGKMWTFEYPPLDYLNGDLRILRR